MKKLFNRLVILVLILTSIYLVNLNWSFLKSFLKFLTSITIPIIIGFTIAFLLYPITLLLQRKLSKNISNIIVFSSFLLIIILMIVFITPKLFRQIIEIMDEIPKIIDQLSEQFNNHSNGLFKKIINSLNIELNISEIIKNQSVGIKNYMMKMGTELLGGIITFVLSIIFSAYILAEYENIISWLKEKTNKRERLRGFLKQTKEVMYAYFVGVILVFIVMFVMALIIFCIMKIRYPILMAFIFAATNLIPYVGPYIGGALVAIFAFCDSIVKGLIVVIVVIILQFVESYVITPRIQSKMLKVKSFFVLIAVLVLGKSLGIIGMVISIPILAILHVFYEQIFLKKSV